MLIKLFEYKGKPLNGKRVLDCQGYKKVVRSLEDDFQFGLAGWYQALLFLIEFQGLVIGLLEVKEFSDSTSSFYHIFG